METANHVMSICSARLCTRNAVVRDGLGQRAARRVRVKRRMRITRSACSSNEDVKVVEVLILVNICCRWTWKVKRTRVTYNCRTASLPLFVGRLHYIESFRKS